MSESTEEFDLAALNDEELIEQVHDDLYNGLKVEVEEATRLFLKRGWSAERVLNDALVEGMRIVGIDFRDGILFVPEVLLAANSMKGGMEILRPLLAETGVEPIGKIVIGTVKGDIHDIGKNLVSMMLEGAGFEVIDLGINNPVEKYLAALEKHKPDILGMSALLTTTMPYMKVVIDTLKERGIRNDYIVLVGGAPLNEEFGKAVGADAYCRDAAVAVETAKGLLAASAPARRRTERGERCGAASSIAEGLAAAALGRRGHADHRLRRAGARDHGAPARRTAGTHSTCAACRPKLHNRPERIPAAVRALIQASRATTLDLRRLRGLRHRRLLDAVLRRRASSASRARTATSSSRPGRCSRELAEAEPGTFYLTDFLLRHFERLVIAASGSIATRSCPCDLLRQLPQARLSGAGAATPARWSRRARDRRAHGSGIRVPRDRLRHARHTPRSAVKRGAEAAAWPR